MYRSIILGNEFGCVESPKDRNSLIDTGEAVTVEVWSLVNC